MKKKLFNILILIIIIISIILIVYGIIKIADINKGIQTSVEEVEGIFCNIENSTEDELKTKVEIQEDENYNGAVGMITFKLDKIYKTAIYNNITNTTLKKGAGRASGTAKLNEKGNCVLYAHRDSRI